MLKNVPTVRFSSLQAKRIEEFLNRNLILDFSTLTRMAIDQFVENPTVQLQPVTKVNKAKVSGKESCNG